MPDDGNTPLDDDESEGLIPDHLATRAELNAWEALNIAEAQEWSHARRRDVLDVALLRELHRRMFGMTWKWAGTFRQSDKNISPVHWSEVPRQMEDLVRNTRAQFDTTSMADAAIDEIAFRFHHRLVQIHPWPNGNGRHGRVATDLLLAHQGRPRFSWGEGDLASVGRARAAYISALKRADAGDFRELAAFVRS